MTEKNIQKPKKLITIYDFIGGGCVGVTQVLVGQPFDLIKVRLQTQGGQALLLAKKILAEGGPAAFYKGTLSPLIGMSFCIALQFTGFNLAQRFIAKAKYNGNTEKLKVSDLVIAGFFSGICYTWIMSPMELFRIKMQVVSEKGPKYVSSIDAAINITKTQGFSGVYFGYIATTIRECIGSAVYFAVYESLINKSLPHHNMNRKEIPLYKSFLFGGLAGVLLWGTIFPLDVIKSRQQGSDFVNTPYRSLINTGKTVFKEKGLRGLYAGLETCLVRAFIVNAASFVCYEVVMKKLRVIQQRRENK